MPPYSPIPKPWIPGYSLPSNVRSQLPGQGAKVTAQAPRGTFFSAGAPASPGRYALPSYVVKEGLGRGAIVTKWSPRGTGYPKGGEGLSELGSLGRSSLGGTSLGGTSLGGTSLGGSSVSARKDVGARRKDPVVSFGGTAADRLLAGLQMLAPAQRKAALKATLDRIDPSLWDTVDAKASAMVRSGKSPKAALKAALAASLSNGMAASIIKIGTARTTTRPFLEGLGATSTNAKVVDKRTGAVPFSMRVYGYQLTNGYTYDGKVSVPASAKIPFTKGLYSLASNKEIKHDLLSDAFELVRKAKGEKALKTLKVTAHGGGKSGTFEGYVYLDAYKNDGTRAGSSYDGPGFAILLVSDHRPEPSTWSTFARDFTDLTNIGTLGLQNAVIVPAAKKVGEGAVAAGKAVGNVVEAGVKAVGGLACSALTSGAGVPVAASVGAMYGGQSGAMLAGAGASGAASMCGGGAPAIQYVDPGRPSLIVPLVLAGAGILALYAVTK